VQQSPPNVQGAPSERQPIAQWPEAQRSPGQHSPSATHAAPDVGEQSHRPASQTPEQHSAPLAQAAENARQIGVPGDGLPPGEQAESSTAIAIADRAFR
jgi:hypothetical protein